MISNLFNPDMYKILILFSLSPGSRFNRNEIKDKTKLNNVPIDKALMSLFNMKILKKENRLYQLNYPYAKKIIDLIKKDFLDLKELPLNTYYSIVDAINLLSPGKSELYLFGSYSKLIYTDKSDIDLAVLGNDRINAGKIEKKYGKNIEIHYFDKIKFYRNKKDPLVKDILKNGIRLI